MGIYQNLYLILKKLKMKLRYYINLIKLNQAYFLLIKELQPIFQYKQKMDQ